MKKTILLLSLIFLLVNGPIIFAEEGGDSVTDFFNQEERDVSESTDSDPSNEEESSVPLLLLDHDSPSMLELIIRIIVVLALIIGLIYLLLKLFNRSGRFNRQGDNLVNLGGLSFGANKSVQMIKVGEKVLLIGVGETISLLTEIEDESIKQSLIEEEKTTDESNVDFTSMFKNELENLKEKRASIRSKLKKEEER